MRIICARIRDNVSHGGVADAVRPGVIRIDVHVSGGPHGCVQKQAVITLRRAVIKLSEIRNVLGGDGVLKIQQTPLIGVGSC